MNYEKKQKFLTDFFYYGVIRAIAFFVIKFGWEYLSPFVIAFVVAFCLKPLINKINVWFKIRRSIAAILCVAAFYALSVAIIALAGVRLVLFIKDSFYMLPAYYEQEIMPALAESLASIQEILTRFDPDLMSSVTDVLSNVLNSFTESVSSISVGAVSYLSSLVAKVPGFFIKTIITVIASFFISVDYYNITFFITKQLSIKQIAFLYEVEEYAKTVVVKYIISYAQILSVTFCEVAIGLSVLRIDNALVIAAIIAIFDILPVRGTGGIIIPWGIISIITGKYFVGIGMLVLYLIITIVRNIVEPKIVGQQVGLHPVATLMAMFLGTKLLGVIGLFGFPISLVILKRLNDTGKIKLFK